MSPKTKVAISYVDRLKQFRPVIDLSSEILGLKEICHHHTKLVELLTTVKNQTLAILD